MTQFFKSGKVSVVMDGAFGSSGKGRMASYIGETQNNWQFACHAFMSNAAHTVVSSHGTFVYQSLSSIAYLHSHYEKTYICGGAVLELEPLLKEIKENGVPAHKLGIHPLVSIVTQKDVDYERGVCNFDGEKFPNVVVNETMTLGSTLHGVGAARARRVLRRKDALLAKDVPELKQYMCDTRKEILDRLDRGQSGLMEIAQGYALGYMEDFYPKTTSRNCTVAAALDDCGIPPYYLGNVLINFRTYPIRVNSDKWLNESGEVLKYSRAQKLKEEGQKVVHVKGDSGRFYEDQEEITWEQVTKDNGHKTPIYEYSTLTENPRRVATFSKINMEEAIRYNKPPEGSHTYLSLNFVNYVDADMGSSLTDKVRKWIGENIPAQHLGSLWLIGYGPQTGQTVEMPLE